MPRPRIKLTAATEPIDVVLAAVRTELGITDAYPPAALADAEAAAAQSLPAPTTVAEAARPCAPVADLRHLPFVTVDPASSTDLDQAAHIEATESGWRLHYAIAALAFFVRPGGPLDEETHQRGLTMYGPGCAVGLHPEVIASGAGSLLREQERLAYVWTIDISDDGALARSHVAPALVRSVAKLSYEQVQRCLDGKEELPSPAPADFPELLAAVGQARQRDEERRGGISLAIPTQEVTATEDGYRLSYRANVPAEEYNAQLSLVTGMAAAQMMRAAGVAIFRTLPPAREQDIRRLRHTARALGLHWDSGVDYPTYVRSLDSTDPAQAAFLNEAATLFRGAGYEVVREEALKTNHPHAAIAAEYAHVTAPLRRLVDRYGLEICAAHCAGLPIPAWVEEGLDELPEVMARAAKTAGEYERRATDVVEAAILAPHVGDVFTATVIDERKDGGLVMLRTPAVRGSVRGNVKAGSTVTVRVVRADVEQGRVELELAD